MLLQYVLHLIVSLYTVQAARATGLYKNHCFELYRDSTMRVRDSSIDAFRNVIECLTVNLREKMVQWMPGVRRCLRSTTARKIEPGNHHQVVIFVRIGTVSCPGFMSSPRQGRLGATCRQLIGTYKKEECRDLCYLIKACKAATYTDGDQTCRVCVQPLPSYQTDNDSGHTSYIRLPMDSSQELVRKIKGAWYRKNPVLEGNIGFDSKLSITLSCAIRCLQDKECHGFTIEIGTTLAQCNLPVVDDPMYVEVPAPFTLS